MSLGAPDTMGKWDGVLDSVALARSGLEKEVDL